MTGRWNGDGKGGDGELRGDGINVMVMGRVMGELICDGIRRRVREGPKIVMGLKRTQNGDGKHY